MSLLSPSHCSRRQSPALRSTSWALTLYIALVSVGGFALTTSNAGRGSPSQASPDSISGSLHPSQWTIFARARARQHRQHRRRARCLRAPVKTAKRRLSGRRLRLSAQASPYLKRPAHWAWLAVAPTMNGVIADRPHHLPRSTCELLRARTPRGDVDDCRRRVGHNFVAFLRVLLLLWPVGPDFYATICSPRSAAICALFANPHRTDRAPVAAAGATGGGANALAIPRALTGTRLLLGCRCSSAARRCSPLRGSPKISTRQENRCMISCGLAPVRFSCWSAESALPVETRTLGHAAAVFLVNRSHLARLAGGGLGSAHGCGAYNLQALSPSRSGQHSGAYPLWRLYLSSPAQRRCYSGPRRSSGAATPACHRSAERGDCPHHSDRHLRGIALDRRWSGRGARRSFTETSLRVLALMAAGSFCYRASMKRRVIGPGADMAWRAGLTRIVGAGSCAQSGGAGRGEPSLRVCRSSIRSPCFCGARCTHVLGRSRLCAATALRAHLRHDPAF